MRKLLIVATCRAIFGMLFLAAASAGHQAGAQDRGDAPIGTSGVGDRKNLAGFDAEIRINADRLLEEAGVLNTGEIVALAPDLKPLTDLLGVDDASVRKVLKSWGPGRYDAELNQDGKTAGPKGQSAATVMPAAFGLAGVNLHTYSGWGSPLHGLFARQKGGFYHDGRFQTLAAVVDRYNDHFKLNLNAQQKTDLIEFLKSL